MDCEICGIYMIQNKVNKKVYIGQSVNIYNRWRQHVYSLRSGQHSNVHLQRVWDKYGESNFLFGVVEQCKEDILDDKEKFWIIQFNAYKFGYNFTEGGSGIKGYKHTDDAKAKIGKASKEKWTDELREHMSKIHTGRIISDETKEKMGESQKARWTDDLRQEYSEKLSGEKNPMYGKRFWGEDNPNYGNHKLAGENNPRCRAVYCPELDEVFWGAKEAQNKYGISKSSITMCCTGKGQHAGKHPDTGVPLRWVYDDERHKINERNYNDPRKKMVYCIELDEYFESASEAGRKCNVNINGIISCCRNKRKSAGRHPVNGGKLHWVYVDNTNNSFIV